MTTNNVLQTTLQNFIKTLDPASLLSKNISPYPNALNTAQTALYNAVIVYNYYINDKSKVAAYQNQFNIVYTQNKTLLNNLSTLLVI
jgi:hypothetical protein